MYEYFSGRVVDIKPDHVVIDNSGVGYRLHISLNTFQWIGAKKEVQLWSYLHVKEDVMALYGFGSLEERATFELLITVSGIGTTTAQLILSSLNPGEVRAAILSQNTSVFKAVKGIGEKTAKRLMLDLNDKIGNIEGSEMLESNLESFSFQKEAESALTSLGFPLGKVKKALNDLGKERNFESVEEMIKACLKKLS
jgi:Holliday junction DNA helicase RuvA